MTCESIAQNEGTKAISWLWKWNRKPLSHCVSKWILLVCVCVCERYRHKNVVRLNFLSSWRPIRSPIHAKFHTGLFKILFCMKVSSIKWDVVGVMQRLLNYQRPLLHSVTLSLFCVKGTNTEYRSHIQTTLQIRFFFHLYLLCHCSVWKVPSQNRRLRKMRDFKIVSEAPVTQRRLFPVSLFCVKGTDSSKWVRYVYRRTPTSPALSVTWDTDVQLTICRRALKHESVRLAKFPPFALCVEACVFKKLNTRTF